MVDPLAEIVTLLQPTAVFSKVASGSGSWRIRRSESGRPFYCVVLDGACRLTVDGREPILLQADDFILIPAAYDFTMTSAKPPPADYVDRKPTMLATGEFRHGNVEAAPDVLLMVGYCAFAAPDAALLVSLLPSLAHIRGDGRFAMLVKLLGEETHADRPARDLILARLLEIILIDAFRSTNSADATPGLARGLADPRLAAALRCVHESPDHPWTVIDLAKAAGLSRSAFFERFNRAVGAAPMEYLLTWRMALAKNMLSARTDSIASIAEQVGYGSASAFSVAFTRHVGSSPGRYLRAAAAARAP